MNESSQLLPCVMIPMNERQLLLPNVSVAEIVDHVAVEPRAGAPAWLVGDLNWRGMQLPVISYDAANGAATPGQAGHRGRIAILNTIGRHHGELPFVAVVTQGIPSQTRIAEDQIRRCDGETGPADLMLVDVDGEIACIPNLEFLESLALEANH